MKNKTKKNAFWYGFILLIIVITFTHLVTASSVKEPISSTADFSKLNLSVSDVRIVESIVERDLISGKPRVTWSANEHNKLVVVTLEGLVTEKNYYTFMPDSFALFCQYQTIGTTKNNEKRIEHVIKRSKAIRVITDTNTDENWSIQGKNYSVTITRILKTGPVKMEIGVIIPSEVNCFEVVIPTILSSYTMAPLQLNSALSKKSSDE